MDWSFIFRVIYNLYYEQISHLIYGGKIMFNEIRMNRAEKKAVALFNKQNDIINEIEISFAFIGLECDEFNEFLDDEIKQLDKTHSKYEKAYKKFEKLQIKNNCRLNGIEVAMA